MLLCGVEDRNASHTRVQREATARINILTMGSREVVTTHSANTFQISAAARRGARRPRGPASEDRPRGRACSPARRRGGLQRDAQRLGSGRSIHIGHVRRSPPRLSATHRLPLAPATSVDVASESWRVVVAGVVTHAQVVPCKPVGCDATIGPDRRRWLSTRSAAPRGRIRPGATRGRASGPRRAAGEHARPRTMAGEAPTPPRGARRRRRAWRARRAGGLRGVVAVVERGGDLDARAGVGGGRRHVSEGARAGRSRARRPPGARGGRRWRGLTLDPRRLQEAGR